MQRYDVFLWGANIFVIIFFGVSVFTPYYYVVLFSKNFFLIYRIASRYYIYREAVTVKRFRKPEGVERIERSRTANQAATAAGANLWRCDRTRSTQAQHH